MMGQDSFRDLSDVAGRCLLEHLGRTQEWFPHTLVPRDPAEIETEREALASLPAGATAAIAVNLLTEDNLPYYYAATLRAFGSDGPWGEWVRRWTAEEARHSTAIRDYVTTFELVDLTGLERARMAVMCAGWQDVREGLPDLLVYATIQELATRISHRNTGHLLNAPYGTRMMTQIARDENLHYIFYRDVAKAALSMDPDRMLMATDVQLRNFQMPGTAIPGFADEALKIAEAGVYNLQIHYQQILVPILIREWDIENLGRLSPAGATARGNILRHLDRLDRYTSQHSALAG
jgi:acyl-[acyl-carrier-protein] desaturase